MQKKYKNKGFGCFGSNCFRKMRKSGYFNTKYLDFKNYLYKIRHYYVIYTKVINRTSLKSFRKAVTQQKRTAPPGRRCDGDCEIFLESGWQLSFRKSAVVASIRVRGGQSFLRGFYGSLRYESIHNCVHPAYTYNTNGRRYFLWTMQ